MLGRPTHSLARWPNERCPDPFTYAVKPGALPRDDPLSTLDLGGVMTAKVSFHP
jgi:hypothetical protein